MDIQPTSSIANVAYEQRRNVAHWHITWIDFESAKTTIPNIGTEILVHLGLTVVRLFLEPTNALVLSADFVRGQEHILKELGLAMDTDVFPTNAYPSKGLFVRTDDFGWFFPRVPPCIHELDIDQAMVEDSLLLLLNYTGPDTLMLPDEINALEDTNFAVAEFLLGFSSTLIASGDDGYGIQVWTKEKSIVEAIQPSGSDDAERTHRQSMS
jgi:hypothetical protein